MVSTVIHAVASKSENPMFLPAAADQFRYIARRALGASTFCFQSHSSVSQHYGKLIPKDADIEAAF
ncbi:MAG: hypothetical protein DMF73_12950 [Acidobacteria bacterium]|nr:MAG: hypothetical protein DMF73_12950 [Acidobacteriota bacterium]